MTDLHHPEETLDPHDWEAIRQLGHRMVDDLMDFLANIREQPVWQPIPNDTRERLKQPLPHDPQGADATYEDFLRDVRPYPLGNIHPRFWGWVIGTGTPISILAEMLSAGQNPNLGGGDHSANYVEQQVIDWCKEMLGYDSSASGLLVSGGSMANLVGLTVGRNTLAGYDIRTSGVQADKQHVIYCSKQAHSSIQKAVELLGLGSQAIHFIPTNDKFEIDLEALDAAIREDRAAGKHPLLIIGNAGTVNTGAFDDLNALADIAAREGMWYHVDGAFGALAALSTKYRHLTDGMTRADSIAFDLHKWFNAPIECGCVLVRNHDQHRRAFSLTPDYLVHANRGAAGGENWFSDYGIQLSRGFRALKIWMMIKTEGIDKYGRLIEQNIDQTAYLAKLVDASPQLERLAAAPLNIVCFRYITDGLDDTALNALNNELLLRLHESGVAVPTSTMLNGKFAIRVAHVNHRTRRDDFDLLVKTVIEIGNELIAEQNTVVQN